MDFREMNLRIFQGQAVPHPLFQPRFEPWYAWHLTFNQMPTEIEHLSLRDLYDDLHVSMRYVHYFTGMPDPIQADYSPEVERVERFVGRQADRIFRTPYGDLSEHLVRTVDEEWRTVGFAVKSPNDLKKLSWLYRNTRFSFSAQNFQLGRDFVGQRGVPQFWVPKSPYQALAQVWMKLNDLIYALADAPGEVEEAMRAIDEAYDPLYEQIAASGSDPDGVRIINFGENLHEALLSPRYFERYLLPFYEKRAGQLHQAGIYSHVHLDGYFRSLLKYLKHLPFDGLEALTPLPQGDVSLEEIKEHIGDKILLDGIPAVFFMDTFSREDLMQAAERVVALFHPRLVLGVSDEVPEGSGLEAIERLRMVSQWCQSRAISPSFQS